MGFVRSEVKQAVSRFRDAIIGVGVSVLGVYWALNSVGIVSLIGVTLAIAGALLVFAGIQRGRFLTGAGGPGVVCVDEGRVTYFGPFHGGSVVIAHLERVELDSSARPVSEWVLHDPAVPPLHIPTNAEGAEALFDVFSGLEGLRTERMLSALSEPRASQVVIWCARRLELH